MNERNERNERNEKPEENPRDDSRASRVAVWMVKYFCVPLLRLMAGSWRVVTVGWNGVEAEHAAGRGVIYALWHNRLLLPVWIFRHKRIHVMVSRHGDGELLAVLLSRFGFVPVRGSANRVGSRRKGGAQALYTMVKCGKEGNDLAFTPDGPRGPAYSIAPGLLALSRLSGLKVVPVGIEVSRCWQLNTWDRLKIPLPFCRMAFVFGAPLEIPDDDGEARNSLMEALKSATDEAARMVGTTSPWQE